MNTQHEYFSSSFYSDETVRIFFMINDIFSVNILGNFINFTENYMANLFLKFFLKILI